MNISTQLHAPAALLPARQPQLSFSPLTKKKVRVLLHPERRHFWNSADFWKVPTQTWACLRVRATCGWIRVLNIGGMILTCASATLSTIIITRTDRGSNTGLHGERPATNRPCHGMAPFKNENHSEWHLKIQFVPRSKHYSVINRSKVMPCKEIIAISSEIHTK